MKAVSIFLVFALLAGIGFASAAESASGSDVSAAVKEALTAAVKEALNEQPTPTPFNVVNDIQGRLPSTLGPEFGPKPYDSRGSKEDFGYGPQGFDPRYGPGPNDFGPNYGPQPGFGPQGPANGFDPGYGGEFDGDFGPGYGPSSGYDKGYGGSGNPQGPNDFGPGYGPGPQHFGPQYGGPQDYRAFGGFQELPEEFVGFAIFDLIGDKMMQKYGEENLMAKCDNQPELVDLVVSEFQQSGLDLKQEFCSDIERGLDYCEEGKKQCNMIGDPAFGPHFGPPGEEEFSFSCPPDKSQIISACKARMASEFSRESEFRKEDAETNCRIRYEFERGHQQQCDGNAQPQPDFCSKGAWMSNCLARQPKQGPEPYQPPQDGRYDQPYPGGPNYPGQENGCPYIEFPHDENQRCIADGKFYREVKDARGCITHYECYEGQKPPSATVRACPSQSELDARALECTNQGGAWSMPTDGSGCPYVNCAYPAATQPGSPGTSPTPQGTAYPSPSAGPICPPLDESYRQSCEQGGGTVTTTQAGGCTYYSCQSPSSGSGGGSESPSPSPTPEATATPSASPSPTPSMEPSPTASPTSEPSPSPTTTAQTATSPFTGFATGAFSPQQFCEQEWTRNEGRFRAECDRIKQNGPQLNACDESAFIQGCMQQELSRIEQDQNRINFDRICDLESNRMLRDLKRYCQDTSRGKEQCLKETERGCEFARKQLNRCQELTSPNQIRPAIEKAVARGCRELRRGSSPDPDKLGQYERRASELRKVRDFLPPSLRSLLDFESDNVAETDETLQQVNQKDLVYALTQIIGLQAEQEKKDAELLKAQNERLAGTIERLKQLREQVDDANAAAILDAQIVDLEEQRVSLGARAESKKQGAFGILSFLSNLFGG